MTPAPNNPRPPANKWQSRRRIQKLRNVARLLVQNYRHDVRVNRTHPWKKAR